MGQMATLPSRWNTAPAHLELPLSIRRLSMSSPVQREDQTQMLKGDESMVK